MWPGVLLCNNACRDFQIQAAAPLRAAHGTKSPGIFIRPTSPFDIIIRSNITQSLMLFFSLVEFHIVRMLVKNQSPYLRIPYLIGSISDNLQSEAYFAFLFGHFVGIFNSIFLVFSSQFCTYFKMQLQSIFLLLQVN